MVTEKSKHSMRRSGGARKSRDEVPDELVFEILSHLPVKSLARFRCVCKAWLYLISHPSFVDVHRSGSPPTLFMSLSNSGPSGCLFSMKDGTFRRLPQLMKLPELTDSWYNSRSVNGLLCMYQDHDGYREKGSFEAMVCNPSTGECETLPPTAFSDPEKRFKCQDLSIGFDPCTNSYKILRIWSVKDIIPRLHYEILTLGSRHALRIIDDDQTSGWVGVPTDGWCLDGICVNGSIYWTEYTLVYNQRAYVHHNSLIAFHVGEEKFRSIPVAPEAQPWNNNAGLFEIAGHILAVAEFLAEYADYEGYYKPGAVKCFLDADIIVIWKLEDSINGVWSKMKIRMREPRSKIQSYCGYYFVAFCDGAKKICYIPHQFKNDDNHDNPYVIYFDIEKATFWKKTVSLPPLRLDIYTLRPCNYIESMVSLKEICGLELQKNHKRIGF